VVVRVCEVPHSPYRLRSPRSFRLVSAVTPEGLAGFLAQMVSNQVRHAVMIWGPPGVGKSSIVSRVASTTDMEVIDVRLSQLAPTDLRGLPVPADGVSRWFPPEFLPTSGRGILFLDELNMAAPTMQGVAQQLILDRRVGSYTLPDGWFVWAAGNRKEDRASVFEMPAPLANRFVHVEVEPDLESFRKWAMTPSASGVVPIDERITSFLAFRPQLLHSIDAKRPAWPSPRSWAMASSLLSAGLPIAAAVGEGAASEFDGFCSVYAMLPALDAILDSTKVTAKATKGSKALAWPEEPSARYALTLGLANRAGDPQRALNGFRWLSERATPEWVHLFTSDVAWRLRASGSFGVLTVLAKEESAFRLFHDEYANLSGHGAPTPDNTGASNGDSAS
jgi:AAA domain (dynein-related subfamily)